MSGFAIVCDARCGESLGVHSLALVDRSKCRSMWWTSDEPEIAIRYARQSAARFAARRLKRNNARVVPFDEAVSILTDQARGIDHASAMSDAEQGWESHKEWIK